MRTHLPILLSLLQFKCHIHHPHGIRSLVMMPLLVEALLQIQGLEIRIKVAVVTIAMTVVVVAVEEVE